VELQFRKQQILNKFITELLHRNSQAKHSTAEIIYLYTVLATQEAEQTTD